MRENPPAPPPGNGKKRDPGNEVGEKFEPQNAKLDHLKVSTTTALSNNNVQALKSGGKFFQHSTYVTVQLIAAIVA